MAEDILKKAKDIENSTIKHRRYLHACPETGFELKNTIAYVKEQLCKLGYEVQECGRGIVAQTGAKSGKTFLLRADMDALAIEENSDLEFASVNGNMHACGHDMHTAMLLSAAEILKSFEDRLKGRVRLVFQPAEETLEGAKEMVNMGAADGADAGVMLHVMSGMPIPSGTIIVSPAGVSAPAADYFEIEVKGKGCHGAMPVQGIDPLSCAAHILIALQEIHARELKIGERAVLTVGELKGANTPNVIPDRVVLGGTMRAFDEDVRSEIKKRISEISKGLSAAFRCNTEVRFTSGCPTLVNDEKLSCDMGVYMKELLGSYALTAKEMGNNSGGASGSEDFSYFSHTIPTVMLALAAGKENRDGKQYPQHHPKVVFDEDVLYKGAAAYAYAAIRWLENN